MWLLHFLPDSFIQFIVHTILLAGIVGCFATFYLANKISGIYFEGGYSAEMQWRARVAEMEAKVAKAEEESREANVKLDKKSAEKVKVIKGREIVVKQFIDREVAKYNDKCDIPKAFVDAHNQSAEQPK
jgi:preprotein translocase subunit SecF